MTEQITKQETKNGGPYTKPEQEERRSKVYELYFEKGYSARKISKELGVHRNTIDSDIRILLSQAASHLGKDKVAGTMLSQIQRFEVQRKRILDFLDPKDFKKSMTAEKLLLAIEDKLASFVSKLGTSSTFEKFGATEEITEEEIVDLVRGIVFSKGYPCNETKKTILEEIVSAQKCNMEHAENVFAKMISLGLELTVDRSYPVSYYLVRFSVMRGYISQEELAGLKQQYEEKIRKEEEQWRKEEEEKKRRKEEIKKRYIEKYGSDTSKWSDPIYEKFQQELYG